MPVTFSPGSCSVKLAEPAPLWRAPWLEPLGWKSKLLQPEGPEAAIY